MELPVPEYVDGQHEFRSITVAENLLWANDGLAYFKKLKTKLKW